MLTAITRNKLFYNFFSLGTVQAISSLVQLIVIPHVISKIGVEGYGVVAVAQVIMFFLAIVTDYSFNQTATREISLNRANMEGVSRIFSRVFFSRIFLCVLAFLILVGLLVIVPFFRSNVFLYLMAFTFVLGHSTMINWFFLGVERMHFITWITLIARLLFAVLVFLFIRGKDDGYLFLFFLGLGNLVAALISLFIAFRHYRLQLKWPGRKGIVYELKDGWQIALSHLSNSTCHYANIFILRLFTTDLVAGYYGIAERLFFAIKQVFVVFSQAVYPRLCQVLQDGRREAILFLKRTYTGFFLLVVLGSVLLFVFSPGVLHFFIGNEYDNAVFYLRVFCIVAVIVCLNIPGTLLLLAANQKQSYLKVYLVAAFLNISLNVILARYYMATGTVIAIFITEFFITIGVTRFANRTNAGTQRLAESLPGSVEY